MKNILHKIYNLLISTKTMVVLFILFATAMGLATFIENDFGTPTARTLVYNSHWFEALMILLAINLTGNIFRFKMDQIKKWPVFIFHIAFLIILLGAAITRYISFEGMMAIREGETTDVVLSDKVYLKIDAVDQQYHNLLQKELKLSVIDVPFLTDNHYQTTVDYNGKPVRVKVLRYIPGATVKFTPDEKAATYLPLVISAGQGRKNIYIKDGERVEVGGKRIGFNRVDQMQINIFAKNDTLYLLSPFEGTWMRMSDQQRFPVIKDSVMPLKQASLYQFGELNFVVSGEPVKGKLEYVSGGKNSTNSDLLRLEIEVDGQTKILDLKGGQYQPENPKRFELNGVNLSVNFGSVHWRLPFQIQLRDFQLEKYPGSKMPKSYASEITVIDSNSSFDYRIFMNHVLDYKGYRFYQSSYSVTPEYEESQLSVNHDKLGTWTTYFGYALLYLGLLMIFVVKGSRFYKLRKMLQKIQNERKTLLSVLLLAGLFNPVSVHSQEARINTDSIVIQTVAPVEKAAAFGHLIIQDYGGRMKPVNTYASELLRKLTKHDTYKTGNGQTYSADQVLTGMISYPQGWWYVPLVYLERGDEKLREIIGVDKQIKYARLVDFFDDEGNYKLQSYIESAQKKRIKSKFDKDVINVSGRVNLLYNTLLGENLRLFPLPEDPNHKWYSWTQIDRLKFDNPEDKNFAKNAVPLWTKEIFKAKTNGDFKLADQILDGIHQYQKRFGKDVYPSEKRVKREIFYNKYDAFRSLFWQFMLLSLVIFIVAIAQVFSRAKLWNYILKALYFISLLLFLWMLLFMGLRWDISGHAPWSNAYESMIYVSFAIILFSLILGRKSALVLSAGLFVGSMTLMIAHWNWMDPQIENLVPVLNSYWLDIHVSIIVASYGPFAIGMILGLLSLLLMALVNDKNKDKLKLQIKELSIITEMALIIGLVMLTIGNFLGGQWANESWGRYWGWDPKETWALISIVVYALVIHARFVPGLRGYFTFNLLAVISFASILMTYFGVNFYLSGLHSYAKGEPQETPVFIYYAIVFIAVLSVLAYYKYKKYFKH
jgi:cytochrome c-type biogenesis protein CcsB